MTDITQSDDPSVGSTKVVRSPTCVPRPSFSPTLSESHGTSYLGPSLVREGPIYDAPPLPSIPLYYPAPSGMIARRPLTLTPSFVPPPVPSSHKEDVSSSF